jgi:hypothetical protein
MGGYCLEHEPVAPAAAAVRRPSVARAAAVGTIAGLIAAFAARLRLAV